MKSYRTRRFDIAAAFAVVAFAFFLPAAAASPDLDVKVQIVGEEIRTQASFFVRAPQQRVWEVITDYERAPEFTRDLEVSKVISRSGNGLRVFQKNQFRLGPFSIPVETVRDVRLVAPVRTESRLVSGSVKKYTAITELVPEAGGTRIVYRSFAVPGGALALLASDSYVKRETEAHFRELRTEILRREHVAAARKEGS
jgi:carbon monoxide dehydrogenase subunit G